MDKTKRKLLTTILLSSFSLLTSAAIASPIALLTGVDSKLRIRKVGNECMEVNGWILKNSDLIPRK